MLPECNNEDCSYLFFDGLNQQINCQPINSLVKPIQYDKEKLSPWNQQISYKPEMNVTVRSEPPQKKVKPKKSTVFDLTSFKQWYSVKNSKEPDLPNFNQTLSNLQMVSPPRSKQVYIKKRDLNFPIIYNTTVDFQPPSKILNSSEVRMINSKKKPKKVYTRHEKKHLIHTVDYKQIDQILVKKKIAFSQLHGQRKPSLKFMEPNILEQSFYCPEKLGIINFPLTIQSQTNGKADIEKELEKQLRMFNRTFLIRNSNKPKPSTIDLNLVPSIEYNKSVMHPKKTKAVSLFSRL